MVMTIDSAEMFECKKFNCRLTVQACADRRKAFKEFRGRFVPVYPGCQDCSQFDKIKNRKRAPVDPEDEITGGVAPDNEITGGDDIMFKKKVDDDELKTQLKEGKTDKQLAEHFGVLPNTIWAARKKLGLKGNSARAAKKAKQHVPAPAAIPAKRIEPVVVPPHNQPGQIIPVTLSLTLEVNVKVNTERA
jgi:hypothetical protein